MSNLLPVWVRWGKLVAMMVTHGRDVEVRRAARAAFRARRATVRVRAERVRRLGLAACAVCGGAIGRPDDTSLMCDCREVLSRLELRVQRLAHEHGGAERAEASTRIAG